MRRKHTWESGLWDGVKVYHHVQKMELIYHTLVNHLRPPNTDAVSKMAAHLNSALYALRNSLIDQVRKLPVSDTDTQLRTNHTIRALRVLATRYAKSSYARLKKNVWKP